MHIAARFCFVSRLMLITAHRLPAPIVEPTENPTPAGEQSVKSKPGRKTKTKIVDEKSERSTKTEEKTETKKNITNSAVTERNALYAGMWKGTLNWGIGGNSDHMIVIDPAEKTATVTNVSGSTYPTSIGLDGISWVTGIFKEHKWTLKPFPDGRTALVTINGHNSAVFRREQ